MAKATSSSLSGIEDFFDDLDAETSPQKRRAQKTESSTKKATDTVTTPQKPATRRPEQQQSTTSTAAPSTPTSLPTGRPPGKKDGEGPRRAKASLWIDAELLEAYRDRVYVERRRISEIIEDALRAYRNSSW